MDYTTRMSIKTWHFGLSRDKWWNYLGFRKTFKSWHFGLSRDKADMGKCFSKTRHVFAAHVGDKTWEMRVASLFGPGTHLKRCASTRAFICAKKCFKTRYWCRFWSILLFWTDCPIGWHLNFNMLLQNLQHFDIPIVLQGTKEVISLAIVVFVTT